MKMREFTVRAVLIALCAIAIGTLTTSCALFSSPDRPGYQAGRTTAVVWMATENVQPTELHAACVTGYQVLSAVYGTSDDASVIDQAASVAVDKLLGDSADAAQKQLILNFFNMAKNRLEGAVTPETPRLVVLANFTAGIDAALSDYGHGEQQ